MGVRGGESNPPTPINQKIDPLDHFGTQPQFKKKKES